MAPHYYIGLDLGQAGDFTAWAVLERPATQEREPAYGLRHLQRFDFGTPFTRIVGDVSRLAGKLATDEDYPTLVVDLTGVGRPVLELIYRAGIKAGINPVCITAGQQASELEDRTQLVPKVELVSCLQILLQGRRLRVAQGLPAAKLLAKELENYRMKVSLATTDKLAAWRDHPQDDLVLAVALACWTAERHPPWSPILPSRSDSLVENLPPGVFAHGDEWPDRW